MNAPKIVFMGSKQFGLELLGQLVEKFPNVEWVLFHPNDLSDSRSVYGQFEQLRRKNVDVKFIKSRDEFSEQIKNLEFKFAIVCGWYWIIPGDLLDRANAPFYGIHHSDLPSYRGGAPLVWALINGETRVGSSLFRIRNGIDDGEIIEKIYYDVSLDDNIYSVMRNLEVAWLSKVKTIFQKMLDDDVVTLDQPMENVSYCTQRRPSDGNIDWTKNAYEVHNFVRAQSHPYPGAFTIVRNELIVVEEVKVFEYPYYSSPGRVIKHSNNEVLIGCGGSSAVVIKKLRGFQNILGVFSRCQFV